MADITVRATYASVVEDEGMVYIGFAEGEDDEEPYVLFRQPAMGGPVWFEVSDEALGAEDALLSVSRGPQGLAIVIRPDRAARFGWAQSVTVKIGPGCEDAPEALAALQAMLGPLWRDEP
ncbi:MAG: hypothetical protein IAE87_05120 [Rhodobacteraceae bacterium]|jgi:hypothetical protein|nr:hypothetical protein [Paracoccaceae bacterium]